MTKKTEGHKIDFSQVILGLDRKPIRIDQRHDPEGIVENSGQDLTLGVMCARALNVVFKTEAELPTEQRAKWGALSVKIFDSTEPLALKSEEITRIKKVIGLFGWSPVGVHRALPMLDPAEVLE